MSDALDEFKERLEQKIKGDIGELMPDAVVKELIVKVIEKEFIAKRKVPNPKYRDSYHNQEPREIDGPPLLFEYLRPRLQEIAKNVIAEYLEINNKLLEEIIRQEIGEGLKDFIAIIIKNLFQQQFDTFKMKLVSELNAKSSGY